VHLVFVTEYRRGVLTREVLEDLHAAFANLCADFEAELVEFDDEDNHVHLLANYPLKISVSALVDSLKGVSNRMNCGKGHPCVRRNLWGDALCAPPHSASSCGGAPTSMLRQYIEQQRTPD
jgi:putative transposase